MDSLSEISIFKLKEGVFYDDVIIHEKLAKYEDSLTEESFSEAGFTVKILCFNTKNYKRKNPPWIDFFNHKIERKISLPTHSVRANGIYYIESNNKSYICPFGISASSIFDKSQVVADYGIKVAMNMCGNENVRQTTSRTHDYKTKNINRQSSLATNSYFFELEDIEILRSISAHPDKNKNITILGKDHLKIKTISKESLSWDKLFEIIDSSEDFYERIDYKKTFPNFDNFQEVNPDKKEELDAILIKELLSENDEKSIHMSVPEFLSDNEYSFTYSVSDNSTIYSFLSLAQLKNKNNIKKEKFSVNYLMNKKVYAYNNEIQETIRNKSWSIYSCLVFDVKDENNSYVLSDGKWTSINQDFFLEINKKYEDIISKKSPLDNFDSILKNKNELFSIKDNGKNNTEKSFNERFAKSIPECIMFDRSKLAIGSSNKMFEFCDLMFLGEDESLYATHVKRQELNLAKVFDQTNLYSESVIKDHSLYENIKQYIKNSENKDKDFFIEYMTTPEGKFTSKNFNIVIWILHKNEKKHLSFMEKYDLIKSKDLLLKLGFKGFYMSFIKVDAHFDAVKGKQKKEIHTLKIESKLDYQDPRILLGTKIGGE